MKNFLNTQTEARFNDLLFENRNKEYGAYALRREEGTILLKSLFIGVAFFASLSVVPLIVSAFQTPTIIKETPGVEIDFTPIDEVPDKAPEIIAPTVPAAPPSVNTYDSRLATPTKDAKVTSEINTVIDNDAIPGIENIVGMPPTTIAPPPVISIVVPPIVVKSKPIDNSPSVVVDVQASFNGGINAFRTKVVQNFNTDHFEGTGDLMKTTVSFIVEKDGTISGIKANGQDAAFNKEAEKTIKNIKGKWAPAQLNGQNVRSYFNFPISMMFE